MFGFEPNEEQRMLVDSVQRYASNDLRAAAHDADEAGQLPAALINKGWELGILQASIPEAYGGFGERSAVTGVLAAEELGWGDLTAGLAVMAPAAYALPILVAGTEEQKKALLPPVVEGEWKPYVSAFLEPNLDFDPAEMRTTAVRKNGSFVLSGVKTMVPYAAQAAGLLVYASLDGKTQAFVVPPGTAGLKVGDREAWCGLNALPTHRLTLESVTVPADARLGGEGGHEAQVLIAATQAATAALAIGLARAAYEYSLAYAKDRTVFGAPIAQKQSIAFMLAEMATDIEAIRLLAWEAAWLLDVGKDAGQAALMAVLGGADCAMMVTDRAVQILGGHGYIREHPVERWMRNGRGVPSFPGLAMV
jgi:alkylation response protein AidB-like acyl-CoA dehydrogenase